MPWYHLSDNPELPNELTELRESKFIYLDVNQPCFSVAPTVSQCIVSVRKDGIRHIYEVDVKSPLPAVEVDSNVRDGELTGEHRITQEVLHREGGAIPLSRLGQLSVDDDMRQKLKIAFRIAFGAERIELDAE